MKKMMMAIAMVMMAMSANAQTLIKGSIQKGDKVTYEVVKKMSAANPMGEGNAEASVAYTTTFEITDATAEGAVVQATVTAAKLEGDETMQQDDAFAAYQTLLNQPVIFTTDANGAAKNLQNWDDVSKKFYAANAATIEKLVAEHPEITQMMSKETLIEKANAAVTEESVLDDITSGIFDLNGKTLKTGDEIVEETKGIKIKNSYTVTPILGTVVVVEKSEAAMNEDETKAFVISKLQEEGLPEEQIKMIEDNWQQMVAMGMAKVDINGTTTYRLGKNGWAQSIETNAVNGVMGVEMKETSSVKLVQ